jgi:hypothetical protein
VPVEIGHDRLDGPVPVAVGDVAAVPGPKQLAVQPRVVRPRLRVRSDADDLAGGVVRIDGELLANARRDVLVDQDSPRSARV